jgi:hypothetical protein
VFLQSARNPVLIIEILQTVDPKLAVDAKWGGSDWGEARDIASAQPIAHDCNDGPFAQSTPSIGRGRRISYPWFPERKKVVHEKLQIAVHFPFLWLVGAGDDTYQEHVLGLLSLGKGKVEADKVDPGTRSSLFRFSVPERVKPVDRKRKNEPIFSCKSS